MLVFGTQIHVVTFIFMVLEFCMLIFQLAQYFYRPQDRNRGWYLLLLVLLLFYNLTGGLFPDPKIKSIPIDVQEMIAYGSGFMMASYFPFYFYKALELRTLRWHAFYGVPLFLFLPYVVFFVIDYAIQGNLNEDLIYGMIAPFIYALILLWVMFRAIREKHRTSQDRHAYLEEIAMYCAITPWAALAFFGLVEADQVIEALCTNTGIVFITLLFTGRSIRQSRQEHLGRLNVAGVIDEESVFVANCARFGLTRRHVEIARLLAKGYTYKQIADTLFLSEKTVNNHIQNIYEKAGAGNKIALLQKLTGR